MKKWFKSKSNIVFLLFLGIVLWRQLPILKNNVQQEDRFYKAERSRSYADNSFIDFPSPNSRSLAIFWASWCGPCKIEMDRLKRSIESGSIPKDAIFAINPFENETEIKKFIKSHNYPFQFIESSLAQELNVSVTPTTIFFDRGKITSMGSGISVFEIWKAEFFL